MLNIESRCDELLSMVSNYTEITRNKILDVLERIQEQHPEVDDDNLVRLGNDIRDAMIEKLELVSLGDVYAMVVVGRLEDRGILPKEKIPDEIDVPAKALEKLAALRVPEKIRKIVVYIILNSSTKIEVKRKTAAAKFPVDPTQLLMPLLHRLIEIDPGAKGYIVSQLQDLKAVRALSDVSDLLEKYCFDRNNTQPYLWISMEYYERVQPQDLNELHEAFVVAMLHVLKGYLLS